MGVIFAACSFFAMVFSGISTTHLAYLFSTSDLLLGLQSTTIGDAFNLENEAYKRLYISPKGFAPSYWTSLAGWRRQNFYEELFGKVVSDYGRLLSHLADLRVQEIIG